MSSFDLKRFLKKNKLTKTSKKLLVEEDNNDSLLSEAKITTSTLGRKKKYQPQFLDHLENEKPFELEPSGEVVLDKSNLTSTGFGQKTLRDILQGGDTEDFNNFFKDGNTYGEVLKGTDGELYKLSDLSKSTFTGQGGGARKKPRDAAYYEMGLCVEYNKRQGMSEEEAFNKAEVDPDKYDKYKEHLTEVCKPVAEDLPNMGSFLRQTGGDSFSPASEWPSSDGTPKTDIFGGSAHRISVKKKGGSQLISGKSGDTKGVFMGGLGFYERYSKQAKKDMEYIIDSIENEFVSLNTDRSVTQIKNGVEDAYVEWRTPDVRKQAKKLGITSKKKINDHVRAELKLIGMTDQRGSYEDWIIEEIGALDEKKIMRWFEGYWKSQATDDLKSEVRDIISAKVSHKKLDEEFKKVFKNNKEFKTWCVYEAASGNFKFSGDNDINTTLDPVANEILVFGEDGSVYVDNVDDKWATNYSDGVDVQVSFKSSGRGKYTALRLTSENVNYNNLSEFEKDMNSILNEEASKIDGSVEQLFEEYNNSLDNVINEYSLRNIVKKMKDAGKRLVRSINNKIKMFYDNVIKRVLTNLYKMAKEGIKKFAEYIGMEIDGKANIDVSF